MVSKENVIDGLCNTIDDLRADLAAAVAERDKLREFVNATLEILTRLTVATMQDGMLYPTWLPKEGEHDVTS